MALRTLSLQARQLLAASLGLVAFLGLTGYALDQAFVETARRGTQERLRNYALGYLASIDFYRGGGIVEPEVPPDARFNRPGSGLYAAIKGSKAKAGGEKAWQLDWSSQSVVGRSVPFDLGPKQLALGEDSFDGPLPIAESGGSVGEVYRYALATEWEREGRPDENLPFTIMVAEDAEAIDRQIGVFRRSLWGYLVGAGLLLLLLQTGVLRWSLRPLRRVMGELTRVQRGSAQRLSGQHPRELAPLTESINAFIVGEREHIDHYRNTLADLAHSLKTPLAVLRSRIDNGAAPAELRAEVQTQVQRMSEIVSYQLSRAATSGHQLFAAPLEIEARAEEIVRSLEKVYADKGVLCEFEIEVRARFYGEPGDLQELLGNLLENAFKWARRRALLTVTPVAGNTRQRDGVRIVVEDDGPGIVREKIEHLLQRGTRGDERVPGHGIGLAIVQDLVRAYRGELEVGRSEELGGARFVATFPPGL